MRYASLAIVLGLFCALGYLFLFSDEATQGRPNVVVISIDSLRPDHMGIYGYDRETTPNIDAFSEDAAIFENYFATSFLTPISEASVHTGLYPLTHGMINFETPMQGSATTLAEVLKTHGWRTAAFGSSLEFQYYPSIQRSFSKGFDTYAINTDYFDLPWRGRGTLRTESAISWMEAQRKKDRPFFLWFTVGSAHWPYGEDEPHHFSDGSYDGPFADTGPEEGSSLSSIFNDTYGRAYKDRLYDAGGNVIKVGLARDVAYVRDRYDDGLVMTDRKLAPLLSYLGQADVAANTIVVIQSEHGESFGEHGYIAHYDIFDTETHVPLVIKGPGVESGRVAGLASGVDIVPTVLDLLGLDIPALDGRSLLPLLGEVASPVRSEVFITRTPLWERVIAASPPRDEEFVKLDDREHFLDTAVRSDSWLLIHRLSREAMLSHSWWGKATGIPVELSEYELYDVRSDPRQEFDVYGRYKDEKTVLRLREALSAWESAQGVPGATEGPRAQVQPYF